MNDDRRILCVDDEPQILSSLRRLLRREPYKVQTAEGGERGLEILHENDVQLIMSDQRMPGMTGIDFLRKAKEIRPDAIRVILSGYADCGLIVEAINEGEIYRFLSKPWNDEELKSTIRQCLGQYDILQANKRLTEQTKQRARELEVLNTELARLNRELKEVADERMQLLQLSREILEKMPVPVVCASREGSLMFANEAAKDAVPGLAMFMPGASMRDVLPASFVIAIDECLDSFQTHCNVSLPWADERVIGWVAPLGTPDSPRGCVVGLGETGVPDSVQEIDFGDL